MKLGLTCLALLGLLAVSAAIKTDCLIQITESIPQGMPIPTALTTTESWLNLISNANKTIDITSFYWTLTGGNPDLGGDEGQKVYDALVDAAKRGVKIRIVQSLPTSSMPDDDTARLLAGGLASVRSLNMTQFEGSGILHSKFWVFDNENAWIGSANMDWRSLTQVKELGAQITNCPSAAADMRKLFEANYEAAADASLPKQWPKSLATQYNQQTPLRILVNGTESNLFFSASPPNFCPQGRTNDIDALVSVIRSARRTVSVSVMDYLPASAFMYPAIYWPVIDDAFRTAAFENGVDVKILIGNWTHSDPKMFAFLRSLQQISPACRSGSIEVKLYTVPEDPRGSEPYTRVNHAKFMVSEQRAFVTTSDWQADYYLSTGGLR